MTAFRISLESRQRLEMFDVVVGTATQPTWLRRNYGKEGATAKKESSPWEIQLYPDVPFPVLNAKPLATGFGNTPDAAVESALSSPFVRYRSGLFAALYRLEAELGALKWATRSAAFRIESPACWSWTDDLDDDIPF